MSNQTPPVKVSVLSSFPSPFFAQVDALSLTDCMCDNVSGLSSATKDGHLRGRFGQLGVHRQVRASLSSIERREEGRIRIRGRDGVRKKSGPGTENGPLADRSAN